MDVVSSKFDFVVIMILSFMLSSDVFSKEKFTYYDLYEQFSVLELDTGICLDVGSLIIKRDVATFSFNSEPLYPNPTTHTANQARKNNI